ncbi:hypothetical protein SI65_02704 [Aspergillus cristatus]|uniref:Uncharacterized protein n=1 Tax=Aspergillus cristatus TaxID=573508 RepID=A0A1E3BLM6_ASPCR|nr:hypothetical protein SI65_02704 [Aspergillus cristatus]
MVPFRNFLARKSGAFNGAQTENNNNENERPSTDSQRGTPLSVRTSSDNPEPPEYKLSVVDDNGSYLPPSPPEKQSFWSRYPGSNRSSNNHRNLVNENEPFSISRESFDSYRRSFDISARSPVSYSDTMPSRTSLDSRFSRITSPSLGHNAFDRPEPMEEEQFEDVGLNDDEVKLPPKKRGVFSRFGDLNFANSNDSQSSAGSKISSPFGFHLPGRKRGQSGAGSELGTVNPPSVDPNANG